jgi:protein-S-isoprenylcysteine O-methyltransferase Ste14
MFARRTWLPLPFAIALLVVAYFRAPSGRLVVWAGPVLVFVGEGIRLWAVRHIGVISRTRADRLGPLVTTGPFSVVRNPLYVGNLFLWSGMACWTGAPWMVAAVWLLFGPLYFFITQWEAQQLELRHGDEFRAYARRVRAWLPRVPPAAELLASPPFSWRETFFSERGTIMAIALMSVLLSVALVARRG